jgi:CubicO group peptidase (beta-lactamase class C family)
LGDQAPVEVFSATKSYTSTLVGIAEADGKLDVDDEVADYVPEWKGTPSEDVTIKNLISNDSGRYWDFETDYQKMIGAADRTAFSIGLSQAADPGAVWVYNNSAIQVLEAVLEKATGQPVADYAQEKIFEPLGMADTKMTTDNAGNANVFFGLQSTCRDMARFGHLFLNEGSWDGTELVSAGWVDEATGAQSTPLNASYGYLWWLNRKGPQPNPIAATDPNAPQAPDGQSVPSAPEDMYWAHGLGDQIIQVDPGSDTVVVRLGPATEPAGGGFGRGQTSDVVTWALVDP